MRSLRIRPVTLAAVIAAIVIVSGVGAWYFLSAIRTGGTPCATPTCDLIQEDDSAPVFKITNLAYPAGALPWDHVIVIMYAEPNDPATYISVSLWWQPDQDNLTSEDGLSITQSLFSLLSGNTSDVGSYAVSLMSKGMDASMTETTSLWCP